MQKYIILWLGYWLFGYLFWGCQDIAKSYTKQLRQIEQQLQTAPDSAYQWLKEKEDVYLLPDDKALYLLLRTEAEDKLYVKHTTDSLIAISRDYFEKNNDLPHLAKAWYLTGRIHADWEQWDKATEEFLKAQELTDGSDDYRLRGLISSHIAEINWHNELYQQAQIYYNDAYQYYIKAKDTVRIAYALKGIGETYMAKYQTDSAICFYKQALFLAKTTQNRRLLQDIYNRLGYMYKKSKQNNEAITHLQKAIQFATDTPYYVYKNIGALFIQTEQLDSARYYLEQALNAPELATRCMANYYLSEVNHLEGNDQKAYDYQKEYELLSDSLDRKKQPNAVIQIQQQMQQQQMQQTYDGLMHKWTGLIVGLVVALLLKGVYIFWRTIRQQKTLSQPEPEKPSEQLEIQPAVPLPMQNVPVENIPSVEELYKKYLSQCEAHPFLFPLLPKQKTLTSKFTSNDWTQFAEAFDSVFIGFTERLKTQCPEITYRELQICQLSIMGVKVARMADLIGGQSDSVSSTKQKIKNKYFKDKGKLETCLLTFLIE